MNSPVSWECNGKEKDFESNVFEHVEEICEGLGLPPVVYKERQFRMDFDGGRGIVDIGLRHSDDSATLIEVKKANRKHPSMAPSEQMKAIGQLLLYKHLFKNRTGITPRLMLIDNKIHKRTLGAFSEERLPITLVEFQKDRVFVPYKIF